MSPLSLSFSLSLKDFTLIPIKKNYSLHSPSLSKILIEWNIHILLSLSISLSLSLSLSLSEIFFTEILI